MKLIAILLILITFSIAATALPPIPHEIYGTITINGHSAEAGHTVSIFTRQREMCGSYTTKQKGTYGLVSCKGDDPESEEKEGPQNSETAIIFVDGTKYGEFEWHSGRITNINITATVHKNYYASLPSLLPSIEKSDALFLALVAINALLLGGLILMMKRMLQE